MSWALANYTNATNFYEIFKANDVLSGGVFSLMIIISLFMILFITFKTKGYPTKNSLAGAIYPSMVIATLLKIGGMLNNKVYYAIIIILAIVGVSMILYKDSSGI